MNVFLATGHQPEYFKFGPPGYAYTAPEALLSQTFPPGSTIQPGTTTVVLDGSAKSTTTAQASLPLYMDGLYHTFQLISTGAGTSTAQVQVSNEDLTGAGITANLNLASSVTATLVQVPVPSQLVTGMLAVGPGIPAGTTITVAGSTVTLSNAATITAVNVPVQFYNLNWVNLGTALTVAAAGSAGLADVSAWKYVRVNVTAVSGTVSVLLGV